jgi:general secretion pathway protein I
VEKVELPNPPQNSLGDGGTSLNLAMPGAGGLDGGVPGAGALGGLGQILNNPAGGAGLNLDAGLQGLGTQVAGQLGMGAAAGGGSGAEGLLSMVMGLVYPSLKLMMEASIRRVTITVHWKEGPNARELGLVQYVTNPQRGGFASGVPGSDGGAGLGLPGLGGGLPGTPGMPGTSSGVTK